MTPRPPQRRIGATRPQREVTDVPEPVQRDRMLDGLISFRRQRLQRLERERNTALEKWRLERVGLRKEKERWRAAVEAARAYWRDARTAFLTMTTTSGQFRKAKAIYERMKIEAEEVHLACRDAVAVCKQARAEFFEARRLVRKANKSYERLKVLQQEIAALHSSDEW